MLWRIAQYFLYLYALSIGHTSSNADCGVQKVKKTHREYIQGKHSFFYINTLGELLKEFSLGGLYHIYLVSYSIYV